jgi:formylglycine-generating enzyme required for sulfatase activity
LPGYWIGRYPVTVAQFETFVHKAGYRPPGRNTLRGSDDHPVVDMTWHDTLAYCRWLSEKTGLAVALPSEAEWEKAAWGADGRIYPWEGAARQKPVQFEHRGRDDGGGPLFTPRRRPLRLCRHGRQ